MFISAFSAAAHFLLLIGIEPATVRGMLLMTVAVVFVLTRLPQPHFLLLVLLIS